MKRSGIRGCLRSGGGGWSVASSGDVCAGCGVCAFGEGGPGLASGLRGFAVGVAGGDDAASAPIFG